MSWIRRHFPSAIALFVVAAAITIVIAEETKGTCMRSRNSLSLRRCTYIIDQNDCLLDVKFLDPQFGIEMSVLKVYSRIRQFEDPQTLFLSFREF